MTQRFYINDKWLFCENYDEEMQKEDFPEESMKKVRIPHTVRETSYDYFDESVYQMVSGYRRHFMVPGKWKGKRIRLTFEGAAHDSTVYLNGREIGSHHCGYTAFCMDITDTVRYGEDNLLVVKLDSRESLNVPPFGYVVDYMTYGGIYRDVYLEVSDEIYIDDVFLYTEGKCKNAPMAAENVSKDKNTKKPLFLPFLPKYEIRLNASVEIKSAGDVPLMARVFVQEDNKESRQIGECSEMAAGEDGITKKIQFVSAPLDVKLWSIEDPKLYTVRVQIMNRDTKELYDERELRFGFRISEFRTDGYYLNGRRIKIRGLNRHQSYPYVGYAMPESMQVMDAKVLKEELGVNAVRTSHYPQSHDFLDACDEMGLLVFTEIPGWQHIGDEDWKNQAVKNTEDMVRQYRNHTSIILWGVRINESQDDDAFYERTNEAAHRLDPSRPTGGVRAGKKSHLLEDVYTYNDFVHDGVLPGCEPKVKVTSDMGKPYLISEYNGHMFPTKAFDCEEHRREHAIRHANVLDAVAGQDDIVGSFAWCMFDYNTHKDFGSGDRICYHGVMDMFRNPKPAAAVYACEGAKNTVLEVSSSMDIGEHPACNRGDTWIFSNADSVKMYKNDQFLKEYFPADSPYNNLRHGPILVDDFIGNAIKEKEKFKPAQARAVKEMLNQTALKGMSHLPKRVYLDAARLILFYHMKFGDAVALYNKYVGDWGGASTVYRFEAIRNGKVVKTVTKAPAVKAHLEAKAEHSELMEKRTYDVTEVRLRMLDEADNLLYFYNEPVSFRVEGPIELIGPKMTALRGGMGGVYVKTTGGIGAGALLITTADGKETKVPFTIKSHRTSQI